MTLHDSAQNRIIAVLQHRAVAPMAIMAAVVAAVFRFIPPVRETFTPDMHNYLLPWVETIHIEGATAYGHMFTDYAPLYTYLLGAVSLLSPGYWMIGIKLLSILADVVLAVAGGYIVAGYCVAGSVIIKRNAGYLAGCTLMWLPTVWINSAAWGQCDAMWGACCMLALLFFLKDMPRAGMLWFGLAFSFKQQAIFFAPVVLVILLAGRMRWWQLLIAPGVYALTCLPCVLAGRSWGSVLGVYLTQGTANEQWSCKFPSIYYFFRDYTYSPSVMIAIMAIVAALSVWLCIVVARSYGRLSEAERKRLIIIFTAFCGVFFPCVLPGMHERYMYLGDVAAVVAAFALLSRPGMWWAAVCTECASLIAVGAVIKNKFHYFGVLESGAVFALAALVLMCRILYLSLKIDSPYQSQTNYD